MDKIATALAILRDDEQLEKLAGVLGGVANVLRAGDKAGQSAAKYLRSKGHTTLAPIARVAPHVAVAAGAKGAYESEPAQNVRKSIQGFKMRRAMRQARRRGYR